MKVKRISNKSELITYHELLKGLEGTNFLIFPKLPIKEVIGDEVKREIDKKHLDLFNNSHFDFVVSNPDHHPIFAVEFDGPHHDIYEKKQRADIRKNRICQIAEFPLIRVTDFELAKIDSVSILEFMIYRFVKYSTEMPRIKKSINDEVESMTDEEREAIIEDGFLDPSYDPHVLFDFEFPFPLQTKIITELKKYSLYFDHIPEGNSHSYWYTVFKSGNIPSHDKFVSLWHYGIYYGRSKTKSISWKEGKLESPGIEVIKDDKIRFSLKWLLKTTEEYDNQISPIEFYSRYGFMPIHFIEVPGISVPSIVESIAEYICYKKVLEWTNTNLEKVSNI